MDASQFHQQCDVLYQQIETLLEDNSIDFDNNGNIIEIYTDNDETIVINKQAPMSQVWLASREGGRHFHFVNDEWVDTRDGSQLLTHLQSIL